MTTARADSGALALLNQDGGIAAELRFALQAFGANIVYEASLHDVDRATLKASGARTVVINLGQNEDALDDIQDLLESPDYEIIVNDSGVSEQLKGSDQARWVRHLAAKILRRPDIVLPPRPVGAEAPPTFAQHWASRVPVAEVIGEAPAPAKAAVVATSLATSASQAGNELTQQVPAPVTSEPTLTIESVQTDGAHLEDALDRFDSFAAATAVADAEETESANLEDADFARALENFDAVAESAASSESHESVADFEALLVAAHGRDALAMQDPDAAPIGRRAQPEELPNLDFDTIDAAIGSVDDLPELKAAPAPAKPAPAPAKAPVAAPDWSLSPTEPERSSVADIAKEFGIEKVPAEVYLTPQVDSEPAEIIDPKKVAESLPRGFASLELEPLETEEDTKPKNTLAYDTGRDLELPTQATKPVKRDDDANKSKDS